MNFFKCSSCGKYIQATEKLCPKCGNINYAKKENVFSATKTISKALNISKLLISFISIAISILMMYCFHSDVVLNTDLFYDDMYMAKYLIGSIFIFAAGIINFVSWNKKDPIMSTFACFIYCLAIYCILEVYNVLSYAMLLVILLLIFAALTYFSIHYDGHSFYLGNSNNRN